MRDLRDTARRLLSDGTVGVVIGYEDTPRGVRPAFVTDPADADRLVFDHRCVHDLVAYVHPSRVPVRALGRPAVVVKACDARAAAVLLREHQLAREDVVLVGVRCGGVTRTPDARELSADTLAARCAGCTTREPALADVVVGPEAPPPPAPAASPTDVEIARLEALSPAERWTFWTAELARCTRCHACRQVCPLCYCRRCLAEARPAWIESSPHARGNLAWHLTRALHLAGRCAGCGECERACPAGIPLTLLARKTAQVTERRFGYVAGDDPAVPGPIGVWRADDAQEFIL